MKRLLKTALAAIVALAALAACKPVLPEYQKIEESDYYAKLTVRVRAVTTIESEEVGIPRCVIKISRTSEPGKEYTFTADANGHLTHTFPLGKPDKKDSPLSDTFTFTVDFEASSDMIGHQKGTLSKTLTIPESDIEQGKRSAENADEWKISCTKQKAQ